MHELGIVVIGRNEGERLRVALQALVGRGVPVVYADSLSSDGSAELARLMGAEVVELDASRPLGMSRGRNQGFQRLLERHPGIRHVQFVDGDCETVEGWLERGRAILDGRPEVALVTGRLRERFRDRSKYHRLADMDWDAPAGETQMSGGNMMVRVDAFRQVGGFDEAVLVSEDWELCLRLRRAGWTLLRIDAEMVLHDIAMTRFGEWWRRAVRTGYGYADGAYLHGRSSDRWYVREMRGILCWGFFLPLLIVLSAWPTRGLSLVLALAYPAQYWRILRYATGRGWRPADARLYSFFCILGVFPMLLGLATYWFRLVARKPKRIIEYKGAPAARTDLNTGPAGN